MQIGQRVAVTGMIVSGALAAIKIAAGVSGHSTVVVADGVESAADVIASGFVLFGLTLAAKPADDNHPYGYGRVETLTGLLIGCQQAMSLYQFAEHFLQKIIHIFLIRHSPADEIAQPRPLLRDDFGDLTVLLDHRNHAHSSSIYFPGRMANANIVVIPAHSRLKRKCSGKRRQRSPPRKWITSKPTRADLHMTVQAHIRRARAVSSFRTCGVENLEHAVESVLPRCEADTEAVV